MKSFFLMLLFSNIGLTQTTVSQRPKDIVSIKEIIPDILVEARYFTSYNFVGKKINGYHVPKCLLTLKAAENLKKVQADLASFNLSLKVYDCYRPQRAVDEFVEWAKDIEDNKMKKAFYPHVKKTELFKKGYIAEKSGHSRGSTVDLTIVDLNQSETEMEKDDELFDCSRAQNRYPETGLDMGTSYDCLDPLSHTAASEHHVRVKINRLLLKSVMEKYGFKNYRKEWWHFSMIDEPYPKTYFDFPVE
jgi:D-alanyl-D-alanine dipeptidase